MVELVLTFILVFVIFAATDPGRGLTGYGVPLAIGICVFICLMHGVGLLRKCWSFQPLFYLFFVPTKFVLAIAFPGQYRQESNSKAMLRVNLDGTV